MIPFRDYLLGLIRDADLNQRRFSQKLGYETTVFVNNVVSGRRHPPYETIDRWIRALKLDATASEEFEIRTIAQHLPERQRHMVEKLWEETVKLRQQRRASSRRRRP